jgi:hypothetical protein
MRVRRQHPGDAPAQEADLVGENPVNMWALLEKQQRSRQIWQEHRRRTRRRRRRRRRENRRQVWQERRRRSRRKQERR